MIANPVTVMPFPSPRTVFVLLGLSLALSACAPRWEPPPGYRGGILTGSPPPERIVVREGDSVYLIARRFNVPMKAIIEVNRLSPPYILYPGQILRLVRPTVYTVVSGDSLYAISRRYGVDMRGIAQANDISPPYTIFPGQKLLIAGSYTSTMAEAPQPSTAERQTTPSRSSTASAPPSPRQGPSSVEPTASRPPPVAPPPPPSRDQRGKNGGALSRMF
jgi:LysM repeat protein